MKAVIFNLTKVEINQCTMELALIYFISKQRQCKKKKKRYMRENGPWQEKKKNRKWVQFRVAAEIVTPPPPKKVWKYFWRALQDGVGKKAQFVAEASKYNWTAHNY